MQTVIHTIVHAIATRMHSSRMHTVRVSDRVLCVCGEGRGGSAQEGGVCPGVAG